MRPAQLTPENAGRRDPGAASPSRFNEAGAINAGKRDDVLDLRLVDALASMRPAQLTPENPLLRGALSANSDGLQ